MREREIARGKRNLKWIKQQLNKKGITDINDVFILLEDSEGNVFIQKRGENE